MEMVLLAIPQVSPFPLAALEICAEKVIPTILGLGHAVLLRNWTRVDLNDTRFSTAAGSQLGYLLNNAPRSRSGAISHRASEVELWCVFVYSLNLPFSDLTSGWAT